MHSRVQISLIFWILGCWSISGFLGPKWALLGPGGLPKGPGMDSASFGPSFSPNGAILSPMGPLFVFQFPKNTFWAQIAPSPVWVHDPYGPRAPSHMGPMAHGGRRPTFRRGVEGRSPPTAKRGVCVCGAGKPPHRKGTLGAIASSEIWNPDNWKDEVKTDLWDQIQDY